MAQPIHSNFSSPPAADVEDDGYVKGAVFAIVRIARQILTFIADFFSFFYSKEKKRDPLPEKIAPQNPSWDKQMRERLKSQLTAQDLLGILNTPKFTSDNKNMAYLQLADDERTAMNCIVRFVSESLQGTAMEHRIARGKEIAARNPFLLLPWLQANF